MPKVIYIDKQDAYVTADGTWLGGGSVSTVTLETAWGVFSLTGSYFGSSGKSLTDGTGVALTPGTHFEYDSALDGSDSSGYDIYDTANSGAFSTGKYFRVVHNGVNVKSGLGLSIIAKDLSSQKIAAPLGTQCFIDPLHGRFLLPRPSYWSKMESDYSLENPIINEGNPLFIKDYVYDLDYYAAKFGNGLRIHAENGNGTQIRIYPKGLSYAIDKGSFTGWAKHSADNNTMKFYFGGASNYVSLDSTTISIYINGLVVATGSTSLQSTFHKIFIVWDKDGSLSDAKTVRVFIDGSATEVCSTTSTWISDSCFVVCTVGSPLTGTTTYNYSQYDNFKFWEHIITQDPTWDWVGGSGIQNAQHPVYGSGAIVGTLGAGYSYIQKTSSPYKITIPTSTGNVEVDDEAPANYSNGFGRFGGGCYKSDYTQFIPNVDFYYDDTLNGGGTHGINIWDTNNTGPMAGGDQAIRICHNTVNVAFAGGLNLTPYAKSLQTIVTPPKDRVYIDPVRGTFCFPRPIYWSRMESASNFRTPDVLDSRYNYAPKYSLYSTNLGNPYTNYPTWTTGGKWGNHLQAYCGDWSGMTSYADLFPLGDGHLNKGCLSCWSYATGGGASAYFRVYLSATTYINHYISLWNGGRIQIVINGAEVSNVGFPAGDWTNIYLMWDTAGGLAGGNRLKLVISNASGGTATYAYPTAWVSDRLVLELYASSWIVGSHAHLDNIKIWDDVPSETSAWEYNSGTGRENALHYIYGSGSSYRPNLLDSYFKANSSNSSLMLTVPGEE